MPQFYGNTSTSASSTAYDIPAKIKSFSLVNKSGGAVLMNVSILYGSTNISIIEKDKSVASGAAYFYGEAPIDIPVGAVIYVLVNGSTDYLFSIE